MHGNILYILLINYLPWRLEFQFHQFGFQRIMGEACIQIASLISQKQPCVHACINLITIKFEKILIEIN